MTDTPDNRNADRAAHKVSNSDSTVVSADSADSETAWTERIRRAVGTPGANVHLGIGDDAAICESPRFPLLLCSDAMVENTHFRFSWMSPEDLGHKALASCLSDIAAMCGKPLYALISLAVRPGLDPDFIDRFYAGLTALARRYNVQVVGGDLARSSHEVFVDVTLAGASERPTTRAGARPGDIVLVSGTLGASRAGLFALENKLNNAPAELRLAHLRPEPRFDVTHIFGTSQAPTSMIDVSDGLASELHHLSRASNCGFEIQENALPISRSTFDFASTQSADAFEWAWAGGEDYQLLFTVDETTWMKGLQDRPDLKRLATPIGRVLPKAEGLVRVRKDGTREELPDSGWSHFRR